MLDYILILICGLFRTFIVYQFMGIFYQRGSFAKSQLIPYGIFFISTTGLYVLFHNPIVNLLSHISCIVLIACYYSKNILKNIFVSIFLYLLNMTCDLIVYIYFTDYISTGETLEIWGFMTLCFMYIILVVIRHIFREKEMTLIPKKYWFCMLTIPFLSIFIILLIFENFILPEYRTSVISMIFAILIANIVSFNLYNSVFISFKSKLNADRLEKQLEVYSNQIRIIEENQKAYASFTHDFKHHVNTIKSMIEESSLEIDLRLMEYLNDMEETYTKDINYVNTGNTDVDALLNCMLAKAHSKLTNVETKVMIPSDYSFDLFTLNVILGNLLDNAIEAAEKTEEKKLSFNMYYERGVIHIHMFNSYNGNLKIKGNSIISPKQNTKLHGIGLKNIQKLLEKNKGHMHIHFDETYFYADLLIYGRPQN